MPSVHLMALVGWCTRSDDMTESLVMHRSSCNRATAREIFLYVRQDLVISGTSLIDDEERSAESGRKKLQKSIY